MDDAVKGLAKDVATHIDQHIRDSIDRLGGPAKPDEQITMDVIDDPTKCGTTIRLTKRRKG